MTDETAGPPPLPLERRQATGRRRWLRVAFAVLGLLAVPPLLFGLLSLCYPFPLARLEAAKARAPLVLDREGRVLRAFIGDDDTWVFWVGHADVSPRLVQATIAVEDERFRHHPGVDPIAVVRAVGQNVARGRIFSGASTITMQCMRLLDHRPRTLASKAIEAFRALQAEWLLTKDEILEWYLNLAPYGGNLIGAEAAALAYFRKHARDLTLGEAALLAGLPQSPSRLRPDRHPRRARVRRDHVLRRMHACGTLSNAELDVALREPVRVERRPFPFEAPHFSLLVRQRTPAKATLRTTLDRRIQAVAERALSQAVAALRRDDMTNGAIVVIENRSAAVRALVGSADFHAAADQGQVNGAIAPRSPGSALKPFTYALAFEHGVCAPATLLGDVPVSYTGYEPENYDRRFRGPVSARDALAHSLNIPAVELLKEVGQPNVHALLKTLGLTTLTRGSGHYGLALTLGSVETTLLELTSAYATLGRLGIHRPYRLLEEEPVAPGRRVLSKGAAYLVADVLADTTRLKGYPLWKSAGGQRKMAWKTGTSFGHRDAWTVAYTPDYTVGVWLGNFDGRPSRALVGIRSAAPVAARIVEQLPDSREPTWFARPDEVVTRPVCAVSGQPLGPHCPRAAEGLCLAGRSAGKACSVHVLARIDTATGCTLCPACTAGRPHTTRVAEVWPPNLAAWLRRHQPHRPLAPPHLAACPRNLDDRRHPRILSPSPEQTYVLLADQPQAEQKLRLEAVSAADTLYWFVDGTLLAASPHGAPTFWPLARGRHAVVCSDGAGRSSRVEFEVCGDGAEVSARASLARR